MANFHSDAGRHVSTEREGRMFHEQHGVWVGEDSIRQGGKSPELPRWLRRPPGHRTEPCRGGSSSDLADWDPPHAVGRFDGLRTDESKRQDVLWRGQTSECPERLARNEAWFNGEQNQPLLRGGKRSAGAGTALSALSARCGRTRRCSYFFSSFLSAFFSSFLGSSFLGRALRSQPIETSTLGRAAFSFFAPASVTFVCHT
jgi:hypothetical protein